MVMNVIGKEFVLAIFMGIVLPGLMFSVAEKLLPEEELPTIATEQNQQATEPSTSEESIIAVLRADGTICNMGLEDYLVGVVLGEMPLSFDTEALKAQAVVARTYTLRRSAMGNKHDDAAVCINSDCCQAFRTPESFAFSGGNEALLKKAEAAVFATAGQVVTYKGALIEATYFSCSGGRTEDAVAVWGNDIPYLQAVDSPGEESATHYTDSVSFTGNEFARLLGLSLKGNPATWLGQVTYTDGGGVDTITIGGTLFKGTDLRKKLNLSSTLFSITTGGDVVKIVTKGFGHRVGMSQYGAQAMALDGSSYRDILAHYYPGTSLTDS